MIKSNGCYTISLLPKELGDKIKDLPRVDWPAEVADEYKSLRSEFTKDKAEYAAWVRKDRDSRMNSTAKTIALYLLECLNFDRGQCDPSHQTIADEIGISRRQVERLMPRIAEAGWLEITRRGKTTTNFYRFRVSVEKVHQILDYADGLRESRAEERERRRRSQYECDPTSASEHAASDPTSECGSDPTSMSVRDPTPMSDKPLKGTFEGEPLKRDSCFETSEDTITREDIPINEIEFGPWIHANIPDRSHHREALHLLRARKMTPDILRRMAA